jgi:cell division protein FtsL
VGVVRYLLVIVLVGVLATCTVNEHVKRVQVGYEVRSLEKERARLQEEQKTAQLAWERAAVPERLVDRAVALGVAQRPELEALTGATR